MASSGTTILQYSRDELINAALRKIGVTGEGVSANPTQLSEGAQALNASLLMLQVLGMPLWKRTELVITLVSGISQYQIGIGKTYSVSMPLKLLQALLNYTTGVSNLNLELVSRYDFNMLPNNSNGLPVKVTFQPFINYGVVSVWPVPDTSVPTGTTITLTYTAPFEVFTSGAETLDFPQEWQQAIIYTLAATLSDEYGLPLMDKQAMEKKADKFVELALSAGAEESSLFFQPNMRG